jgi:rubrerythrin
MLEEIGMTTATETKKWVCVRCGYMEEGEHPPDLCPMPDCGAGPEDFELQE